jgi:hypothetical protein
MSPAPDDPRALAALVGGGHRPDLSARIAACRCSETVRAGLHLLNGDWEPAHRAAQALDDAIGCHWHALVHRHEPDLANSKYWLRRVGHSPIYPQLAAAAREAGHTEVLTADGGWDAPRFADCFADGSQAAWTHPLDALEQRALLKVCLSGES